MVWDLPNPSGLGDLDSSQQADVVHEVHGRATQFVGRGLRPVIEQVSREGWSLSGLLRCLPHFKY